MRLLIALAVFAAAPAAAQTSTPAANPTHFVVFNRPGPNFDKARDPAMRETIMAHYRLYRGMADDGRIIAGGRMAGDPMIGLSVFRADVDRAAIKAILEADPSVKAGITAVEFREWEMQMGAIARPAGR
jgi:YCII-related domain